MLPATTYPAQYQQLPDLGRLYGNRDSNGISIFPTPHRVRLLRGAYNWNFSQRDTEWYTRDGLKICPQYRKCHQCRRFAETVTVHHRCLAVFKEQYSTPTTTPQAEREAMNRLFVFAAWKYPWRDFPLVRFARPVQRDPEHVPMDLAWRVGLGGYITIPLELRSRIWGLSSTAPFWRFIKVANIARMLSSPAIPYGPHRVVPLSTVVSWRPGEFPTTLAQDEALWDGAIRLTIDSHGIQAIDRLPEKPKFRRGRFDDKVFAVLDANSLHGLQLVVKYGYVRIHPIPWVRCSPINLWDTPTPPDLWRWMPQGYYHTLVRNPYRVFRTIDLESTTGLTFVYDMNLQDPSARSELVAIHTHTEASPSAQPTVDEIFLARDRLRWYYLPLSTQDHIVTFGVSRLMNEGVPSESMKPAAQAVEVWSQQNGPVFLFGKSISGCVTVGPSYPENHASTFTFQSVRPEVMVYSISEDCHGGVLFGSLGNLAEDADETQSRVQSLFVPDLAPRFSHKHEKWAKGDKFVHYSWWEHPQATLEDSANRSALRRSNPMDYRGIILQYWDGSQQVLGECRVGGAAPYQQHRNPKGIWVYQYSPTRTRTIRTYLTFTDTEPPSWWRNGVYADTVFEEGKQLLFRDEPFDSTMAWIIDEN
ncbi:hypothetical protein B0T22DRAFT_534573 [Podospora appendiculata]|uniref:Uncharacterized protein n=1 Tax=Podospora appendiculata TaxID=314037 RepID=A0AAE0XLW2_9PEZI|nr:hypothetical protein B0T22DRAFT_534573 [Podospora appendiculata]